MSRKPDPIALLPDAPLATLPSEGGCYVIDANGALQKAPDQLAPSVPETAAETAAETEA